MKPTKTNEAYASLAYRKSIVQHLTAYVKRSFIGLDGEPKETLICEDVFQVDSEVPPEEFVSYMEELYQEEAELDLEMRKFEFARKEKNVKTGRQPQKKASRKSGKKTKGQTN